VHRAHALLCTFSTQPFRKVSVINCTETQWPVAVISYMLALSLQGPVDEIALMILISLSLRHFSLWASMVVYLKTT